MTEEELRILNQYDEVVYDFENPTSRFSVFWDLWGSLIIAFLIGFGLGYWV